MAEERTLHQILEAEDKLLDEILTKQFELRTAIHAKDWNNLMAIISDINLLSDEFKHVDEERETCSDSINDNDDGTLLAKVRGKLVQSKAINTALGDYISITRGFVRGIIEEAVPQARNTVYQRNGKVVHPQPVSVVVNTLY